MVSQQLTGGPYNILLSSANKGGSWTTISAAYTGVGLIIPTQDYQRKTVGTMQNGDYRAVWVSGQKILHQFCCKQLCTVPPSRTETGNIPRELCAQRYGTMTGIYQQKTAHHTQYLQCNGYGGNVIAMKLVTEGLNYNPQSADRWMDASLRLINALRRGMLRDQGSVQKKGWALLHPRDLMSTTDQTPDTALIEEPYTKRYAGTGDKTNL